MTTHILNNTLSDPNPHHDHTGRAESLPHFIPSPTGLTPASTFGFNTTSGAPHYVSPFITNSTTQKPSFFGQKFHSFTTKAGRPLNRAANVIGAEGWWPTSMQQECGKAARILHSFTSLGIPPPSRANGPKHPIGITRKSMVKIPNDVLRNCAGLAIFNVIRAGAFHGSLAVGSGVVIAHRPDGTWSPPSSFIVTAIGAGFMLGLDIYDCVCVLNTPSQVNAFTKPRVSIGGNASIAVGPVGTGGSIDAALSKTARPIWSYVKSRGLWAGVLIEGTVIVSRADANAVFYNERRISAKKILRSDVAWPRGGKPLFEVLNAIEGRPDFDQTLVREVGQISPPGDAVVQYQRDVPTAVPHEQVDKNLQQTEGPPDETVLDEKERLRKAGF